MVAAEGGNKGMPTEKLLETTEEPSLSELREMLVYIQITINNILLENKRICHEVSELKARICTQQSEITAVKDALAQTRKQRAETENELSAFCHCARTRCSSSEKVAVLVWRDEFREKTACSRS